MTNKEFDKIIDILNNIKTYDVDSSPKGEEKRIALDFAIQLVDHEKCIVNVCRKYYQSVGVPDEQLEAMVKLRNDSGADEISKRFDKLAEVGENYPMFLDEFIKNKGE